MVLDLLILVARIVTLLERFQAFRRVCAPHLTGDVLTVGIVIAALRYWRPRVVGTLVVLVSPELGFLSSMQELSLAILVNTLAMDKQLLALNAYTDQLLRVHFKVHLQQVDVLYTMPFDLGMDE